MYKLSPKGGKRGGFVPVSSFRAFAYAGVVAVLLFTIVANPALANDANQTTLDKIEVTLELNGESLKDLFKKIESQTDLKFVFFENQISTFNNLTLSKATRSVRNVLELMLSGTGLSYIQSDNTVYIRKGPNSARKNSGGTSFVEKIPVLPLPQAVELQYFTVTGKVTDATNSQPMAGVSIVVKGTTNGTSTDSDGQFTLKVDSEDYLVFSFIGYQTIEVPVSGKTLIEISLKEDAATLQAVTVNAGYYNVDKVESTGSIAKVDSDIIGKQPVANPIAALSGRMPGVLVQQGTGVPGGNFRVQIRGQNSLRDTGNEPLYIVDGVPFSTEVVSSQKLSSSLFVGGQPSPLTGLNASDIESIEVLKDADATAIYGSRGANGVVLITTKRGKSGKSKIDINAYTGVAKTATIELLNTKEYLSIRREAFVNNNLTPSSDVANPGYAPDLTIWDTTRYTNWQKIFLGGLARSTNVQASISGGNDNTQFMISGGYRQEGNVYPGNFGYSKGSVHLTLNNSSMDKKLLINASVTGTLDRNNQPAFDATNLSATLPPDAPALFDSRGMLNWEKSTWTNPMASLLQVYDNHVTTLITNVGLYYYLTPKLGLKINSGFTNVNSHGYQTNPSTMADPSRHLTSANSTIRTSNGFDQSWVLEPQMDWKADVFNGRLSALVGGSFQSERFELTTTDYQGFPNNSLLRDVSVASLTTPVEYSSYIYRYAAGFARINYALRGRYFINLTGRRDGSTRFGPGKQFANFGAAGVSWIFSGEPWMIDKFRFLSLGKLRASYGVTGSDKIGNYQFLDTYTNTGNRYQGITGLGPSRLFNPDFAWETNKKMEAAMELGFFNDKLYLTVAYFRNRSSSQLVNYTLPLTTGFTGILANLDATVQNAGWELDMTSTNLRRGSLKWMTSFNITIPKNKLVAFPNLESSSYANTYVVGESVNIQKLYKYVGVDPQKGLYTVKDFNENGSITAEDDKKQNVFIGQYFYGGLSNSILLGQFTLDIFFQFVKQSGYNYLWYGPMPGEQANYPRAILKETIWHAPGDQATVQKLSIRNDAAAANAQLLYGTSDAAVSDASFIRLKNVAISYAIPKRLTRQISCILNFRAQNLFVLTPYKSFDPESQYTSIAPLRMFTLGAQITL